MLSPPHIYSFTHTKLKGLLVIRNSCFPWATRRLRTANVSSPLRMYFSEREDGSARASSVTLCSGRPLPQATALPYPCLVQSTGT